MKKFFLLFPLIFCLSSCWDYTEPSAQNYVLGIGIDYIDNKFNLCIEAVNITGEPISETSAQGIIIESTGTTLFDAARNAIIKAGKKLYWGHTELVIMSNLVAEEHLDAVCDLISRSPDIYSNVSLVVSKDFSPHEILKAPTQQGGMVSTHITNILENEEASHRFTNCELWQLLRGFSHTLVPVIHLDDYPTVDGSAVFNGLALIGYLSGDETQIFSLLQNDSIGGYIPDINVVGNTISLEILHTRRKSDRVDIFVALTNSQIPFDITVPDNRKKIEAAAKEKIMSQINAFSLKPSGNFLDLSSYDVHVTLSSSGLKKW